MKTKNLNKLSHLKLWENFNVDDTDDTEDLDISQEVNKNMEGENVSTFTITLKNPLDLGNNFTYEHFVDALKDNDEVVDIMHAVRRMEITSEVIITAQGNYGTVSQHWVVDEFPFSPKDFENL